MATSRWELELDKDTRLYTGCQAPCELITKVPDTNLCFIGCKLINEQDDGAEGTQTPAGVWFRGDPAGASAEEARRNARGKRSAWSGIIKLMQKKFFQPDIKLKRYLI